MKCDGVLDVIESTGVMDSSIWSRRPRRAAAGDDGTLVGDIHGSGSSALGLAVVSTGDPAVSRYPPVHGMAHPNQMSHSEAHRCPRRQGTEVYPVPPISRGPEYA